MLREGEHGAGRGCQVGGRYSLLSDLAVTWRLGVARSVLGVDLDAENVALASAQLPDPLRSVVTFQVADITAMELPAASFDVAVLSWSL